MLISKTYLLRSLCHSLILILCVSSVSLFAENGEGVEYTFQYYKDNNGVDVKSNVVDIGKNLGEYFSVDVKYLVDAISGASRTDDKRYTGAKDTITTSSKAIDIDGFTSATSQEKRREVGGTLKFFGDFLKFFNEEKESDDPTGISVTGKYSKENNYISYTAALGISQDLFQRNTTIGVTASKSWDDTDPAHSVYEGGLDNHGWNYYGGGHRETENVSVYVTQGFSPTTIATIIGSYTFDRGYLSRPYYLFEINDIFYPENLPSERKMRSVSVKLAQYLPFLNGVSVQMKYRYYEDSWWIKSHTGEFRLSFRVGDHFVIRPSYRGYVQDKAFFYKDKYLTKPQYLTTDFKYRAATTNAVGLKLYYELQDYFGSEDLPALSLVPVSIDLSCDYYMRSSTKDPEVRNHHYSYWDTDDGYRSFIIQSSVKFAF